VLDNAKHPDARLGKDGNRQAGALYDLIPAVPQNAKKAGEWNHVKILVYFPPVDEVEMEIITTRDEIVKITKEPTAATTHKWKGYIGLGSTHYTGNKDLFSVNFYAFTNLDIYHYDFLKYNLQMEGSAAFERSRNKTSVNNADELITFSTYFTKRWSHYILEEIGYDKPNKLNLRTDVETGIGYILLYYSKFKFTIKNGIGRVDSFYYTNSKKHEGYFAYVPRFVLYGEHETFIFKNDTAFRFSLEKFSNYILSSDTKLYVPLSKSYYLLLRYEIDYNSDPPRVVKKLDTKATLNLLYHF